MNLDEFILILIKNWGLLKEKEEKEKNDLLTCEAAPQVKINFSDLLLMSCGYNFTKEFY